MTKVTKKKNRKLRRQIRKTVGALFMISAIVVAAVPVPDVSANITDAVQRVEVVNYTDSSMVSWRPVGGTGGKTAPSDWRSQVPFVTAADVARDANGEVIRNSRGEIQTVNSTGTEIYTTRDGLYQFAYVRPNSTASNRVAVILGASINELPKDEQNRNTLEIPDSVDAYRKYTINTSSSGYVAVSQNNTFLYWRKEIPQKNTDGDELYRVPSVDWANLTAITQYYSDNRGKVEARNGKFFLVETKDANGGDLTTPVYHELIPLVTYQYQPCYAETYNEWGTTDDDDLYVWTNNTIAPVAENRLQVARNSALLSATATPTATASASPTATASVSPTPTATASVSPTATVSVSPTATPTGTATASPTATPEATASATPSAVPTASVTALPTQTPETTPTAMPAAAASATPEPTAELSPTPEITPEPESTAEPTPLETPVPTGTPVEQPTAEPVSTENPGSEPAQDQEEDTTEDTDSAKAVFIKEETVSYSVDTSVMAQRQPVKIEPKVITEVKTGANPAASPDLTQYYVQVRDMPNRDQYRRIRAVDVRYIGRQTLEKNPDETSPQEWLVIDEVTSANPEDGVFSGKGQIVKLVVGNKMLGIGDYAFYGCTGIQSVTLGNGLNTLGNGAFAFCNNMIECNMDLNCEIKALGKDAFMNCQALKSLVIPVSVTAIGDYCFQGCTGLEKIELCGGAEGSNANLNLIGYRAFENCSSLSSITFPVGFRQSYPASYGYQNENDKLPISYFEGCTSLQYIKVQNSNVDIVDEGFGEVDGGEGDHVDYGTADGCSIENFLKAAPDIFYFEGPEISEIHRTATAHSAAFRYLNQDKYEKVMQCPELDEQGNPKHEATYVVNSKNQLVDMVIDRECGIVEIPARIGAYGVETLSSTSFQNNCYLRKITIPATVKLIETNAFKGCHNLKDVIFSQPENAELVIQSNAFNTQEVAVHSLNCPTNNTVEDTPVLNFAGSISPTAVPFQYAMDPANNINAGNQTEHTYITFYSGWPTNLAVRYNHNTDKNELIGYPRYDNFTGDDYMDGVAWDELPYASAEYSAAVTDAAGGHPATQEGSNALNAATNINLPGGIESIKPGLFSTKESNGEDVNADRNIESVTVNTVETIDPYAFEGCTGLKRFYMSGGTKIDNYAFKNCESLETVSVAASVTELGIRPFAGCENLMGVDFAQGTGEEGSVSSPFICENQVIYGINAEGAKTKVIECLETRGLGSASRVGPDELAGITEIAEEAFMGCNEIGGVDLSASAIKTIPRQCFAMTERLSNVVLPETARSISKGAFWNSGVSVVEIPASVSYIEPGAFDNVVTQTHKIVASDGETTEKEFDEIVLDGEGRPTVDPDAKRRTVSFYAPEGSAAEIYTENYDYITFEKVKPVIKHMVYFWDNFDPANPQLLDSQEVLDGADAIPPEVKAYDGYRFVRWSNSYTDVSRQMDLYTIYEPIADTYYHVTFYNWDDTIWDEQDVKAGENARTPLSPTREGYNFVKWRPEYTNIQEDTKIYAEFEKIDSDATKFTVTFYNYDDTVLSTQRIAPGQAATAPATPTRDGYVFDTWRPADFSNITKDLDVYAQYKPASGNNGSNNGGNNGGNGNGSGDDDDRDSKASATPTPEIIYRTPETRKYTVSVSGGSGSGSYAAGDIVAINAYYMGTGQNFDRWTTSTAGVGFANPSASSTTFTMPAANVAITATYNTGSGTPAQPAGTGGNAGGSSGSTGSSGNRGNNGTSVEVTRPGISNTDIAGATVSGATDNFVVKVTEDSAATEAVTAALQARYGDLSRIKYLPMDISLYDSTGRTKIADTTGISVNITLPLPDDLIQYAGNNRAAAVANGALEDLNTRFTTVDGVPCINFTATHFSPYTIYVDTANLMDGTIDSTPKTGDPIHPKWFLAMGMACIAIILFFKRDKATAVKRKVA